MAKDNFNYFCSLIFFLTQCSMLVRLNFYDKTIHPSIHFLYPLNPWVGSRGGGAYPSGHRARGGVHPGQVASPSQGHTETNETNKHTHAQENFRDTN